MKVYLQPCTVGLKKPLLKCVCMCLCICAYVYMHVYISAVYPEGQMHSEVTCSCVESSHCETVFQSSGCFCCYSGEVE